MPEPEDIVNTNREYIAPQTDEQKKLVQIWQEVLGIKQVGIKDNFFELGGDSIISIQVVSRANKLGLTLTPKDVFRHQNIAELSGVATIGENVKKSRTRFIGRNSTLNSSTT